MQHVWLRLSSVEKEHNTPNLVHCQVFVSQGPWDSRFCQSVGLNFCSGQNPEFAPSIPSFFDLLSPKICVHLVLAPRGWASHKKNQGGTRVHPDPCWFSQRKSEQKRYIYIYLSIYLSIYLFIYLFIYLSIYQNISGINNTQASSEIWFSRRPLATANLAVAPKSVAQGTEHCLPSSEFNHPFEG